MAEIEFSVLARACLRRRERRRGAFHGSAGPVRYCPAYPPATAATLQARTVPGAAFPAPPGRPPSTRGQALRPRDPGHLFPPSLLQAQQKSSAQQAQGHMVMPASPGAGLVLVQPHVAFLRLELRFYTPTGSSHVCQGLQRGILRRIGQIVAGFAAVQIPAVNGPVDFAGLAPAGWTHPLGTEQVAAGPWLPSATVISRHASSVMASARSAIVRRCPLRSLGLRGRPNP